MAVCPKCKSRDIIREEKRIEIKNEEVGHLVMRSWLEPGGIMKNRKHYRTETTCTCKNCGHVFEGRSRREIAIAIFGVILLACFVILDIVNQSGG